MTVDAPAEVITLELHALLYPRYAVDQAIAAFAAFGDFEVGAAGDYHRVTIRPAPGATATLAGDLANYALSAAVVGPPPEEPAAESAPAAEPAPVAEQPAGDE